MPTNIPEQIIEEIVDRLERITIANGFDFDVDSVTRSNREGTNWKPRPLAIVIDGIEDVRDEELSHPGNPPAIAHILTVPVKFFANISSSSTAPHDRQTMLMSSNITKAITNPVSSPTTWYTMANLAIDTEVGDLLIFDSASGDHAGGTMPIVVTYRVSENNPFQVRV